MATSRTKNQEATATEIPDVTPADQQQIAKRREIDDIVPEVMGTASSFDESVLKDGATFDYFVSLTEHAHGAVVDAADELGDGFTVLRKEQKSLLVDVPCLFMEWAFRDGDFSRPFVSVRVVAKLPGGAIGKFILNDGGVGIAEQLAKYQKATGRTGGLFARGGLSRSDYEVEIEGKMSPATTYYINTASTA